MGFPAAGGLELPLWVSVLCLLEALSTHCVGFCRAQLPMEKEPSAGVMDQPSSWPGSIPWLLSLHFLTGKVPPAPTAALRELGGSEKGWR